MENEQEKELETELETELEVDAEKAKDVSDSELDSLLSQYQTKVIEGSDIIEETSNEFSEQETVKKKRGRKKGSKNKSTDIPESEFIDSQLLTGSLLILVIDILFPLVIVTVSNMLNKSAKITAEDLQLTEKQKKDLTPVADAVAKKINIDNPLLLMVVCLGGIYGMNYTTALALKKETLKTDKENEKDNN
jgi:hypothetical protein